MESYILSTLFSVCGSYFNRSYSSTLSVGKKIKSLNWTIMLRENTLNILKPDVIDVIKYVLCSYVQGHVSRRKPLNMCHFRAFKPTVPGPLHMLTHTWVFWFSASI